MYIFSELFVKGFAGTPIIWQQTEVWDTLNWIVANNPGFISP